VRTAGVLAGALLIAAALASAPARSPTRRAAQALQPTATAAAASGRRRDRLRFGIYPWGSAGCAGKCAPAVAENADRSMAAVLQLGRGHPFVVHLFGDYDGVSDASVDSLVREASWWSAAGMQIAAVLRYRPADAGSVAGYPAWVRTQARRLAALSSTVSIQIANEPNNKASGAGDGSYPGVLDAIAAAVPAARSEVVAAGRPDILIGFNWAAGLHPAITEPMWSQLRRSGGRAFSHAVGFVAVSVYPGVWTPRASTSGRPASRIARTIRRTLGALRNRHMTAAGVGKASIVIGEAGYPTTAARTEVTQKKVLRAIVTVVDQTKASYGVTDLYWFGLRDGNTASGRLEDGYGLLRDDYSAKPAFRTLQRLVARPGHA
jgi:hypothetical protein